METKRMVRSTHEFIISFQQRSLCVAKALEETRKAFIIVEREAVSGGAQKKLWSGYFVVILSRVENFHYTFCVCMKHFFSFFASRRRCCGMGNFHFFLLLIFAALELFANEYFSLSYYSDALKLKFMESLRKQIFSTE